MMGFDLGWPINKVACTFATTVRRKLFSEPERENRRAVWLLGASFISEGAIPFAAAESWRVIASSMAGSAVTGALVMVFGNTLRAPHCGIWVTPLSGGSLLYLLAIAIGTLVTSAVVVSHSRPPTPARSGRRSRRPSSSRPDPHVRSIHSLQSCRKLTLNRQRSRRHEP